MRKLSISPWLPLFLLFGVGIGAGLGIDCCIAAARERAAPNDERDPQELRRFDQKRARLVELRQQARALLRLGRQTGNPLPLIAAAQIFQETPVPRPLAVALPASAPRTPPGPSPVALPVALSVPEPADLLSEARAMARAQNGAAQKETLALLEKIALSEVFIRGAAMGPQQACDALSPNVSLAYNIIYEGQERAVVAISGDGPPELQVTVADQDGNVLGKATDRSLIAWHPRVQGIFRVLIENRSAQRISFCLETN